MFVIFLCGQNCPNRAEETFLNSLFETVRTVQIGQENGLLLCWLEQRDKSEVRQQVFRLKKSYFWPSRPLQRPFCGTRGEGLVSRVPTFASRVATKSPK